MPRRETFGPDPAMPECDGLHIVGYLIDLGVTEGEIALPYREIESWQRQTGVELQPWEIRFVKRLSEAYMSESHRARAHDAEAPWAGAPYSAQYRLNTANRMKMMIRGIS